MACAQLSVSLSAQLPSELVETGDFALTVAAAQLQVVDQGQYKNKELLLLPKTTAHTDKSQTFL